MEHINADSVTGFQKVLADMDTQIKTMEQEERCNKDLKGKVLSEILS